MVTKILLAGTAIAALAAPAHAEATKLADSGNWAVYQLSADNNVARSCRVETASTDPMWVLMFEARENYPRILVTVFHKDWNPTGNGLYFLIDGNRPWGEPNAASTSSDAIWTSISPAFARRLVDEVTAGSNISVSMPGTGWQWGPLSLSGTTAVWADFMRCTETIAPAVVASIQSASESGPFPALPAPMAVPSAPIQQPSDPLSRIFGPAAFTTHQTEIPLTPTKSGTVFLTAKINGREFPLMLDSGASDISVPTEFARQLVADGTLARIDFLGQKKYSTANGTIEEPTFRLKSVSLGNQTVYDVTASVDDGDTAPLLGQAFLRRFKSYSVDNARNVLMPGDPI